MARRIGYARVSTDDQSLIIQKAALEADKCAIVFEEKRSGTKREGRAQLDLALKVLQKGDTLVVTRLDRLGRSLRDLANIAHEIDAIGFTCASSSRASILRLRRAVPFSACSRCSRSLKATCAGSVKAKGLLKPKRPASTQEASRV